MTFEPALKFSDFLIIGAQKCGTSFLYDHLVQHPNVQPAVRKEVHYFDNNFDKGQAWYAEQIQSSLKNKPDVRFGEASPYYIFHPLAAQRIHELIPQVKLIVLLRNPVARAFSHYQHNRKKEREPLSFEEAIAKEGERLDGEREKIIRDPSYDSLNYRHFSYASRGVYVDQLLTYFEFFERGQFLIIEAENFFQNTPSVFKEVLDFLNLPVWEPKEFKPIHVGNYREQIKEETRLQLESYFKEHNQRLYDLIGETYSW